MRPSGIGPHGGTAFEEASAGAVLPPRREEPMVRRYVAPILRVVLFLLILMTPLFLAAIAGGAEIEGRFLVTLRSLVLAERPGDRWPGGPRLPASAPAKLLEARDGKFLVEAASGGKIARGWAEAGAFVVLDGPEQKFETLVASAKLLLASNDRPVLSAAYLREAIRRDASSSEAWLLLGRAGERIAAAARLGEDGRPNAPASLAAQWGVRLLPAPDGRTFRYDGEAYRRVIALSPAPEMAEEARLRLLLFCGPLVDPKAADLSAAGQRERDLGEYLASFPSSPRRYAFLMERSRLLVALAEGHAKRGAVEAALASRDAALDAASEASVVAPDAARKRSADRLIARLTKSFPRKLESDRPAASPAGYRAAFVVRAGRTLLTVTRSDGRDAIQPLPIAGADPTTLAFDATGNRLAWDESPEPGRRRTRVLDLTRAVVVEPAASAEPELVAVAGSPAAGSPAAADRYSTFLGFSPDGRHLLVVLEGFTADGTRIPRRHVLCDTEGKARPVVVERPFSAPGVVDWTRVTAQTAKLSG